MMGAWAIGVFSVAGVVNQIAIALFRRPQAATEPDLHPAAVIRTAGRQHRIRRVASAETVDRDLREFAIDRSRTESDK